MSLFLTNKPHVTLFNKSFYDLFAFFLIMIEKRQDDHNDNLIWFIVATVYSVFSVSPQSLEKENKLIIIIIISRDRDREILPSFPLEDMTIHPLLPLEDIGFRPTSFRRQGILPHFLYRSQQPLLPDS